MSYDLQASVSLDARAMIAAAQQADKALNNLDGRAGALQRQLERGYTGMKATAEQLMAQRIATANLTEAQREQLTTLLQRNINEKKAQAQAAETAAAQAAMLAEVKRGEKQRKAAIDSVLGSINQEAAAIGKTAAQMQILELKANGATRAQIEQAKSAQAVIAAHSRLQGLGNLSDFGRMALGAAGIAGGAGLLREIDNWTAFQNRLKLVHQTQQEIAAASEGIIDIAKRTGQNLSETATVYQRFAANQKELNLNQTQMLKLTETVNKAIVVGGSTAEGASAALTQFGQALASGVLRGEEFNSVMEQAPGLARALADGLGVPVGALRVMAGNGELTADRVVKALTRAGTSVDEAFGKMDLTVAQSAQVFKTAITEFVGKSSDASGAAGMLSGGIRTLAQHVDVLAVGLAALVGIGVARWAVVSAASLLQTGAAMLVMARHGAAAAAGSNAAAAGATRMATASAIATMQTGGFVGSLKLLAMVGGQTATALQLHAARISALQFAGAGFGAWIAGAAAATAAVYSLMTALEALNKFSNGKDASNSISDGFDALLDKLGLLDSRVETFGTRLAGVAQRPKSAFEWIQLTVSPIAGALWTWTRPLESATERAKQLQAAVEAVSGYQSVSGKIEAAGGAIQYQIQNKGADDLKKSMGDLVSKYAEQAQSIGKTTEELDKLRAAATRSAYEAAQRRAFEESFRDSPNSAALVDESVKKSMAEFDKDMAGLAAAMSKAEEAALAKAEADKQAQNAAAVQETIRGLERQQEELGKSNAEIAAMRAAAQGASEAEQEKIRSIGAVIAEYDKQKAVMASLDGLQNELDRIGLSAKEVKLLDLKNNGATAEQLAKASSLLDAIAAKESAQQKISDAGGSMLTAADGMNQAAAKMNGADFERWKQEGGEDYAAAMARGRADYERSLAKLEAATADYRRREDERMAQPQTVRRDGGDGMIYGTFSEAAKAAAIKMQAQAEASAVAAQQTTTAAALQQSAAHSLNVAAQALAVPAKTVQPAAMQPVAQTADMGRVTLDLRLPDGKVLTGVLFGNKEFLSSLKKESYKSIEKFIADTAAAVSA